MIIYLTYKLMILFFKDRVLCYLGWLLNSLCSLDWPQIHDVPALWVCYGLQTNVSICLFTLIVLVGRDLFWRPILGPCTSCACWTSAWKSDFYPHFLFHLLTYEREGFNELHILVLSSLCSPRRPSYLSSSDSPVSGIIGWLCIS